MFGRWIERYDQYHPNGELKKVVLNGIQPQVTEFYNYKMGIARQTTVGNRYGSGTVSAYKEVDNYGNVRKSTDFEGVSTSYTYDEGNRLTGVNYENAFWSDATIFYNDEENSRTVSLGNFLKTQYLNGINQIKKIHVRDSQNYQTNRYSVFKYDSFGRLIFKSIWSDMDSPIDGTHYEYDILGRRVEERLSVSDTTRRWEYLAGNKIKFLDGRNFATTTTYESRGRHHLLQPIEIEAETTVAVTAGPPTGNCRFFIQEYNFWFNFPCGEFGMAPSDGAGIPAELIRTSLSYNHFGNVESITQGGIMENRIYDEFQQLCKIVRPDSGINTYEHSPLGQKVWQALGASTSTYGCGGTDNNAKVNYTYDYRGDLWKTSLADGSLISEIRLDANGSRELVRSQHVTSTFALDDRGNVKSQNTSIAGVDYQFGWTYDSLGNMDSVTYPDSRTVEYQNNALGQATTVGDYVHSARYHPQGPLERFNYGNGIQRFFQMDASGLPESIIDSFGNQSPIYHTYEFDKEFNVTAIHDTEIPDYSLTNLEYDGVNRLTSGEGYWGQMSFDYDDMGNIKKYQLGDDILDYQYANNNRLSSISGARQRTFNYDTKGNVTHNGQHAFYYNHVNQLYRADSNIHFQYDGNNLRTIKSTPSGTTHFVYGPNSELLSRKDPDGTQINYIYLDGKVVAEDNSGTVTYLHNDILGSVVGRSNASADIIARYHYEPFGKSLDSQVSNSLANNSLGYTGHLQDTDVDLTYMKARYYDPVIGRFYSNDPVGVMGHDFAVHGFNRYAYGNNNPYKYVDPTGQIAESVWDAASLSVGLVSLGNNIAAGNWSAAGMDTIGVIADAAALAIPVVPGGASIAIKAGDVTKGAARKQVMKEQGIPTSQQPISQSKNASGREYQYGVPKPGGGTQIKSVQQQTLDRSHPGKGHWEAGTAKTDPLTGQVRMNDHGRPKLGNDKSKVDYDD